MTSLSSDIRDFIKKFTPPLPMDAVAHELGIQVKYSRLKDVSGIIQRQDNGKYLIEVNSQDTDQQRRFTIAHEIGHYILHKDIVDKTPMSRGGNGITDDEHYRSSLGIDMEIEANQFAAELLMPADMIRDTIKEHKERGDKITIKTLADIFNVSYTAMRIRLGSPT